MLDKYIGFNNDQISGEYYNNDPGANIWYQTRDNETGMISTYSIPRPFKIRNTVKETFINAVQTGIGKVLNKTYGFENWAKNIYYNPKKAVRQAVDFLKNNKEEIELATALAPLPVRYAYNKAKAKVQNWLVDKPGGDYVNAAIDIATGKYKPGQMFNYYTDKYTSQETRRRAIVAAAFNKIKKDYKIKQKEEKKQEVEKRRIDYREMKEKALNARLQRGVNRYMYGRYKYENRQNHFNEGGGYPSRYESTGGKKYKSNRYHTQRKRIPRRIYFQLRKEGKIKWYHGNMVILPNRYGY